jgi:hypothetical protein
MTPKSSPYAQLWRLGAGNIHHSALQRTERPEAAALMRELELDHLEADPSIDRQLHKLMKLHKEDGDQRSALARLCLRCRASGVAASHLKALVANYRNLSRRALQPELEELAIFILDDKGELDPDGASARQPHEPFLLWVVRGWDPDRASLPSWVKLAINGHNGIKKLEAHYGIYRISTWAILAHRVSEKAIRDHWSFLGDGDMKPEEAINLLRDYQRHYPQAIQDYRARTGRRNGWLPGEEFLRQVNPHGDWGTTLANLKAIANFWRSLIFGPNQNIATGTARTAPDSPKDGSGSDETTPDLLQLLASEEDARLVLAQVESVRRTLLDSITFPPSYKPLRQRLRANGERLLCACRGQAEGRSFGDEKEEKQGGLQRNQRQIADECGCSQPTIQRDIKLLETWAGEIAVDAAELLKTTPGFEKLGRSETLIDEVAAALCELLLKPLNYGEQALLCQAIDHHLHSS